MLHFVIFAVFDHFKKNEMNHIFSLRIKIGYCCNNSLKRAFNNEFEIHVDIFYIVMWESVANVQALVKKGCSN